MSGCHTRRSRVGMYVGTGGDERRTWSRVGELRDMGQGITPLECARGWQVERALATQDGSSASARRQSHSEHLCSHRSLSLEGHSRALDVRHLATFLASTMCNLTRAPRRSCVTHFSAASPMCASTSLSRQSCATSRLSSVLLGLDLGCRAVDGEVDDGACWVETWDGR
eukprot:3925917-Pleurochrysis_carterae.AAC.1